MSAIDMWGLAVLLAALIVWLWTRLDDKEPPGAP